MTNHKNRLDKLEKQNAPPDERPAIMLQRVIDYRAGIVDGAPEAPADSIPVRVVDYEPQPGDVVKRLGIDLDRI
jgi:hypothetical protein